MVWCLTWDNSMHTLSLKNRLKSHMLGMGFAITKLRSGYLYKSFEKRMQPQKSQLWNRRWHSAMKWLQYWCQLLLMIYWREHHYNHFGYHVWFHNLSFLEGYTLFKFWLVFVRGIVLLGIKVKYIQYVNLLCFSQGLKKRLVVAKKLVVDD